MTAAPRISMRERLRTDYHWTERQREVLDLLARGKTNAEIGQALGLQLTGVKWHVSEILSKLDAETREEAAEYWRRHNGLAPRLVRTFRGLAAATALKWLGGAATMLALGGVVVVIAARGDEKVPAVGASTPTRTAASPTQVQSTPTPVTPFYAVLAGIEIMERTDDLSAFDICPEVGLQPLTVADAIAVVTGDGPFGVSELPAGVKLHDSVPPDVFTCRGAPAQLFATFRVEPGTADVNPSGGSAVIYRSTGPPQLGRSHPRNAWTEIPIAGGTGVLLTTPTGSRGAGCDAAYWDEPASTFTWVSAPTGDAPFCERLLRAIVE